MQATGNITGRSRRTFLADLGMGFTGLALATLLHRDGVVRGAGSASVVTPDGTPHAKPRAKNVIWIFLVGGLSHVESFDPKPMITKYAGKTIGDTPFKNALDSPLVKSNLREFAKGQRQLLKTLYPLQVGFGRRGDSGIEMSDWFPHLGSCADDLAVVRSMWTTDNDHGAQLQFHTGRHVLEGPFPTIGSWVHYGLGSLNDNLPAFVVMGGQLSECCGGRNGHGASYLGPQHGGVPLSVDPASPLAFGKRAAGVTAEQQAMEFDLVRDLNRLAGVEYPDDPALLARVKSYELAFAMQSAVPEVVNVDAESAATRAMYGFGNGAAEPFARQCLVARRLVERGVRFVQVLHGTNSGAGAWDSHSKLKENHAKLCGQVDQPIAALIKDLKQRGMLDETIVVIATEFGRTPGAEGGDGRDHHPFGFSVALAGGGIRGGVAHGATDEIGFHAVEDRHYVTDVHATILHQLGLDPRKLEVPGRKRLEIDFGNVITPILA